METIVQLFVDFVAEYGILAAVVFGLMYNDRRKSDQQTKVLQGMIENQKQETRQQDKLITQHGLTIAQMQRSDDRIDSMEDVLTRWFKTQAIANLEINEISKISIATLEKNTEGVTGMTTKLDDVLTELAALRLDVQQLVVTVTAKTTEYENRIRQMENDIKKSTQETSSILIEKPKPGVPITPKPKNETEQEIAE